MINSGNEIFTIVIKKWSDEGKRKSINGKQTVKYKVDCEEFHSGTPK